MHSNAFGVAILAAGASSRMGQPKMLLPWGATTVLGHLVQQWRDVGAVRIAVVHAEGDPAITAELKRLGIGDDQRITNANPARGMFSSIQCAARWNGWPPVSHVAFALGDQPHLSLATLRSAAQFASLHAGKVCQPRRAGRPRHPVFVPAEMFEALASSAANTLKEFLAPWADHRQFIEIDDPALDLDIDTPADYATVRERYEDRA